MEGSEEFRVVLVGMTGVGKTSLVERFQAVAPGFVPEPNPTFGSNTVEVSVRREEKLYFVKIVDVAGESPAWDGVKGVKSCMAVFDKSNAESLSGLDELIQKIRSLSDGADVPVLLVGNKSDLPQSVPEERIVNWMKAQGGMHRMDVSAHTGNGVSEAFRFLFDLALGTVAPRPPRIPARPVTDIEQMEEEPAHGRRKDKKCKICGCTICGCRVCGCCCAVA
jgi:small GTP-binding protein